MDLVTTNVFIEGLAARLTPWIAGGLGIAIALLAIFRGWTILRDLAYGGESESLDEHHENDAANDEEDEEESEKEQ